MRGIDIRSGIPAGAALGLILLAAASGLARQGAASGGLGPSFQGAGAGSPVAFTAVPLPPVHVGPSNEPAILASHPFAPSFAQLVNGETIITSEAQMRHVWRRLFAVPYDAGLFDFDRDFVVLMGGGFVHPAIGFQITVVERFEATLEDAYGLPDTYVEPALAVVGTTILPGPPPREEDFVYRIAAVRVAQSQLDDILFNRQVLALP